MFLNGKRVIINISNTQKSLQLLSLSHVRTNDLVSNINRFDLISILNSRLEL